MPDLTAKRTLVKSPPELWEELSEVDRLARHLDAFGEIRITKLEPEHTVAWEGEHASGTVSIEPAGWGTKVTLTAELPELEPEPHAPDRVAEEPVVEELVEEPVAQEPVAEEPVAEEPARRGTGCRRAACRGTGCRRAGCRGTARRGARGIRARRARAPRPEAQARLLGLALQGAHGRLAALPRGAGAVAGAGMPVHPEPVEPEPVEPEPVEPVVSEALEPPLVEPSRPRARRA